MAEIKDEGRNGWLSRTLASKMGQSSCKQGGHRCYGYEEAGAGRRGSAGALIDELQTLMTG